MVNAAQTRQATVGGVSAHWQLSQCARGEWSGKKNAMEMEGAASASVTVLPLTDPSVKRKKELARCLVGILFEIFPIYRCLYQLAYAHTYSVDLSCYVSTLSFCSMWPYARSVYGWLCDLTTHVSTALPSLQNKRITTKMQVCCWPLIMSS